MMGNRSMLHGAVPRVGHHQAVREQRVRACLGLTIRTPGAPWPRMAEAARLMAQCINDKMARQKPGQRRPGHERIHHAPSRCPLRSPTPHARIATARQRAAWLLLGLMVLSVLLAGWAPAWAAPGFDSVLRLADDPGRPHRVGHSPAAQPGRLAGRGLLGLAGAVAQGLFRNPLADPFCWAVPRAHRWVWPSPWRCLAWPVPPVWLASLGLTGAWHRAPSCWAVLLTLVLAQGVQQRCACCW